MAGAPQRPDEPLAPGTIRIDGEARRTTLAEHGRQTVVAPQPFAFVPRDLALMARVGREVHGDVTLRDKPGAAAIRTVGLSLARLGTADIASMDVAARGVEVAKLTLGDLKYMGFMRRSEEQAGIVDHPGGWQCPKCAEHIGATTLDLAKLGLTVWDAAPVATVALRHPWEFEGQAVKEVAVTVAPLHAWYERQSEDEAANEILAGMALVAASIVRIGDRKMQAGSVTLDDLARVSKATGTAMHRADYDLLSGAVQALQGSPDRSIQWTHDGCGGEGGIPLRWHADFF